MKNQCRWLWHDFGRCKKVDWCPRNVCSGSCKITVWGKVINRHRKSLQFRSESILLKICRQVRKSVEHTELHFFVELACGDFQGCMSMSCWNLVQQDDQSRGNHRYHFIASSRRTPWQKSPGNESFSICTMGSKPIYPVHWGPVKGSRAAHLPYPEEAHTGKRCQWGEEGSNWGLRVPKSSY